MIISIQLRKVSRMVQYVLFKRLPKNKRNILIPVRFLRVPLLSYPEFLYRVSKMLVHPGFPLKACGNDSFGGN